MAENTQEYELTHGYHELKGIPRARYSVMQWGKNKMCLVEHIESGVTYSVERKYLHELPPRNDPPQPTADDQAEDDREWEMLKDLGYRLEGHTKRAELTIVLPSGELHRITKVAVLGSSVELYTLGNNVKKSQKLLFWTYTALLNAVIAGAAR